MADLDIVIKALRDEASWAQMDSDTITAQIGYYLERVATNIEEQRTGLMRTAGIAAAGTREEAISQTLKALKRFPGIDDIPVILNALYDAGVRDGWQQMQESL